MQNKVELLTSVKNPRIYAYTEPQYKNTEWVGKRTGKGLLKIGYTERSVIERINEQFPTKKPTDTPYSVLFEDSAIRNDGTFFGDKNVHDVLEKMGVHRICIERKNDTEWFEATVEDIVIAVESIKHRTLPKLARQNSFEMRPEQAHAVDITSKYFKENAQNKTGKIPHFLWNAKMRFGKTFTAYKLAEKMGWKKVLILTFKPAVENAWQEDLENHKDFIDWQFIHKDGLSYDLADKNRPIVWFASFQDVLGKSPSGGIKAHNEDMHTTNWDCVILDEYHFGAWRENAKDLFDNGEIDEDEYDEIKKSGQDYYDEDLMPITTSAYLYLSGTPFRAMGSGEFLEDQIFSWTYSDEQRAKEAWGDKPNNPYLELPQMVLMTYQMPDEIRKVALKGEFNEFDLNEFFKAEKLSENNYQFRYKDAVQKWLNLLRGQYLPSEENHLKTRVLPPMPYADIRLLSACHTLWFLPNVASCMAMEQLLKSPANSFFHDYKIIPCAGVKAGVGVGALGPVTDKIGNGFSTKTITLTCGKLLTGVSVPQWGAILMLRNTTSPETYFQSAFRVQTPWKLKNPDGKSPNEVQIIKEKCYIFDFAPDRALSQIATYSSGLNANTQESPEKKVSEFIHFLPVICYDGSHMKQLDAGEILDLVVSGTASTMLARRWESALLVNVDNETLQRILNNQQVLDVLEKIEGFRNLNQELTTILNKSESLKKLKKEKTESLNKKEKKEITEQEKEIKSLRKRIQEKLLKFATRIPIFMYLTDHREESLKDIVTKLEPMLFKKVTGLSISDFELLVDINIFNSSLMNQAIFAFKRFEDSSLSYSGIIKHHESHIGGWDTKISKEEYLQCVK